MKRPISIQMYKSRNETHKNEIRIKLNIFFSVDRKSKKKKKKQVLFPSTGSDIVFVFLLFLQ